MTLSRARRIDELFDRALDREERERAAFLDGECGDDAELRAEVDALLTSHAEMGDFLGRPATESVGEIVADAVEPLTPGTVVGAYEIQRLLGTGSAGAVYEAVQARPRRRVALKVMASGLGSEHALRRFQEEAEILARLEHPGIAHVYEGGVHRVDDVDLPFFALEFVAGGRTIVEYADAEGLRTRARLQLAARVCEAVHHGHQKGVIHRDLKPGNILVGDNGQAKVIDFGIARVEGLDADRREIAGTLQYMSPEQCRPGGEDVDVRSDVYSLGVVLYELLAGRGPYRVDDLALPEALRVVQLQAPARIEQHSRALRGDVAAIVHKALAKDPPARYASAAALAADIRRHLEFEPVEAVAGGALYHLAKFARRRRLAALSLVAVVLVSVTAAVVGTNLAYEKERERERSEFQAYVANLAAASSALRVHDVADARQRLESVPEPLRGWEWRVLHSRLDLSNETLRWEDARLRTGAVSPSGALIAASGELLPDRQTRQVQVWDSGTGRVLHSFAALPRADSLTFSADETLLAIGYYQGSVEIRDATTGALVRELAGHVDEERPIAETHVNALVFDSDGRHLVSAAGDGRIRLWDVQTGELVRELAGHDDRVISLAPLPGGERIASGGRDGLVKVWELASGRELQRIHAHDASVEGVAVSPDGTRLATVSRDETVRLFDLSTGELVASRHAHSNNVRAVAFSPDGQRFASASWDRTVRLWSAADGSELAVLRGHRDAVVALAFLPDGGQLVSFSVSGAVKTWSTDLGRHVPALRGHADHVVAVAFTPEGRRVASLSAFTDRTVRVWDVSTRRTVALFEDVKAPKAQLRVSPDGEWLLRCAPQTVLRSWSLRSGGPARDVPTIQHVGAYAGVGSRIYVLAAAGEVQAFDTGSWEAVARFSTDHEACVRLEASPDGDVIAVGSAAGEVSLWSATSHERVAAWRGDGTHVLDIAFDPSGSRVGVAVRGTDDVQVLTSSRLTPVATLRGHVGNVRAVAFSPDGRRIATAGDDSAVRIWDATTFELVVVLHGHRNAVRDLAWSPDSTTLVTAGGTLEEPGEILLWESHANGVR